MIPARGWIVPIGAILILLAICVNARAEPCPPKLYACWQARLAFEHYGERRVIEKARACGWTAKQIAEALRCQK